MSGFQQWSHQHREDYTSWSLSQKQSHLTSLVFQRYEVPWLLRLWRVEYHLWTCREWGGQIEIKKTHTHFEFQGNIWSVWWVIYWISVFLNICVCSLVSGQSAGNWCIIWTHSRCPAGRLWCRVCSAMHTVHIASYCKLDQVWYCLTLSGTGSV